MTTKISVIGAGNVGATCAQRLAEKNLGDIVLVDIVEGIPQGKALDIMQSGPVVGFNSLVIGTNDFADIKDSSLVIVTAGLARKPGMSRDDLLKMNAAIITDVVNNIKKYAPNSIILLVTNPLDTMTYLAWKVSGFPPNRVLGMAPLLDLARMATFIALELNAPITEVKAVVLGTHGDLMVPVPSQTTVKGQSITELLSDNKIKQIVTRTQNGGAEIVAHLKTGSAYYAPSAAAVYMAEAVLKDTKETIISSVYANGEYGLKDLYVGLPAKLGKNGVEEIVEIELTEEERAALQKSAEAIKNNNAKIQ
ncbi:malate dehydrogenase [candidate division WOR-1 bacterium RIFOXYB2_FULL_42_35]|uniref:Malate dehydrogenase n=1 Tax=candidate division WOR-1 bacterium RIFOXYC2_FULL_41_25 TaxID=1802586 RepID=A0A1F4TIZ9_UNCSA|nr:MAG: malate dehydrogenase [candidate division WOR-1 bacterium RIFOXYA2_FULL_41_14]OGC21797.1 MAG: malate dehydrogenase [candidate division WOR-1 bacterium RIFOXYB2_FULL_42_35]OGC32695.1 MAG: malate dehydrogenase [candidate division WOR-1 bacterium RIFOXYC2_FULL_41_25]OGC41544.1 MAG: malate dehydrogenase [candidate division WOR-1 bacterium RIFOXYD2_FULL_41_8]